MLNSYFIRSTVPLYTSHILCTKYKEGSETQLTVIVLVLLKIVGQIQVSLFITDGNYEAFYSVIKRFRYIKSHLT